MSLILGFLIFAAFSHIRNNICTASPVIAPEIITAPANAYPFIVSIHERHCCQKLWKCTKFRQICGGSLITRKHVITSAHCFDKGASIDDYQVKVGSNDLKKGTAHLIKAWLTYDNWAKSNNELSKYPDNDIAVIELLQPVLPGMKLARITTASDDDLRDRNVLSAGWGTINNGTNPRYLVEVQLKMISPDKCAYNIYAGRNFTKPYILQKNKFCTNGDPYAVLYCGDSGSPLLMNGDEIIGINCSHCPAAASGLITKKEQNIHIDVRAYSNFIGALTDHCTVVESNSSASSC